MENKENTMHTINDAINVLRGNWKTFPAFYWNSKDNVDNPDNYCIVYTLTRDSNNLELSNDKYICDRLDRFMNNNMVLREHHRHWAVGWVEGFAIQVLDKNNNPTMAFLEWIDIQSELEDYPILDEIDFNNRQYESTLENICSECSEIDFGSYPDLLHKIYVWLIENKSEDMDDSNNFGAYPHSENILQAYYAITGRFCNE